MRFVCVFLLFSLEEGGSSDMLGGQWSWQKPGEDFCSNCFALTWDAKCPWNILPRMLLYVWWWKFFVSTGIWDVKYPWNNFPQNTSAALGECFGFSNLFAVSRIFGRTLHGFKGAPQKRLRPKKNRNPLKHYIVEKEMCFPCVRFVYVIYFVWMKEGPGMCWVVSGPGKSLGWMFLFPLVSEMPNTLGIIHISETLWACLGKFCFHRYLRCQIPVE